MSLKVVDRAPEARCYECGSTEICSVCHHCSRPMCAEHGSVAIREKVASVPAGPAAAGSTTPGAPGDEGLGNPDAKPASWEFGWLKLPPIRAAVHHCKEHNHTVGFLTGRLMGRNQGPGAEPPLPVFPDINDVSVVEKLTGEVQLTDAGYASTSQPVEGTVVIGMTHAKAHWHETLSRYRKRFQLSQDFPVKFAAGWAMLRGKAGLTFEAGQEAVLPDGLGLVFHGYLSGHDLFDAKRGRPEGEWELAARYQLQSARNPQDIPLWIVPSLGATSGKRVLMIDLHWNMPETDGDRAELSQFELIEFQVPHQWGNLQDAWPPGAASSAPEKGQPRVIRWRQHRPAGARRHDSGPTAAPQSMTLRMEFEKPILDQPRLSGSLRATFDRTLSGVTGVDYYLPGGGQARQLEVTPRTEVSVRFDISLSSLRYQERRAVPDDGTGEDAARRVSPPFRGVMPDYRTVIELTNAISADGYYVKTVVEDHPNHDPRDKTFKRGWDITGRWYEGVFPINFIISLRGTEPEDSVASALAQTEAHVTVDGTFPNAEMKKKIEDKWDGLHDRVASLLAGRAVPMGDAGPGAINGPAVSRPPAIDAPAAPVSAQLSAQAPGESSDGFVHGEVIDRREVPVPGDQTALAAELQQQRRDLRLLFGESSLISERTCQEAIADIRAEMRYLEQPDALPGGPVSPEAEAGVAVLLRQRKGLRGKLIAGQLSESFYRDEVTDINEELKDCGWSQ